jgi:uncharacterized phage protein (TIGR01671 family)
MRELKFRIWSHRLKEWDSHWEMDTWGKIIDLNEERQDFNDVLCQYTGLKDKDGREIYEGDIIFSPDIGNAEVLWEEGDCGFCIMTTRRSGAYLTQGYINSLGFMVVGNIYEHGSG